jgi:hypothetical protein
MIHRDTIAIDIQEERKIDKERRTQTRSKKLYNVTVFKDRGSLLCRLGELA